MSLFDVPRRGIVRGMLGFGVFRASPPIATQFSVSMSSASSTIGCVSTVTITPAGGAWPPDTILTLLAANIAGTFGSATLSPTASRAISTTFTASASATGSVNAIASTRMVSTGPAVITAIPRGVGAAALQSFSGIPTSGTAFNPLSQGMLIYSNIPIAYVCLFHNGTDNGPRVAFGGGQLPNLTSQDPVGGSYSIRAYDAAMGGNCFYESSSITIGSNPNRVGGSLTFTPTSIIAWKKTASNGGNLLNNDTYIAANSPLKDASIYASTSGTIPPDRPGGNSGVIGSRAHIVDADYTRLYVNNLYVRGIGTVYVWVIATSAVDGTTTRSILSSISPIMVS